MGIIENIKKSMLKSLAESLGFTPVNTTDLRHLRNNIEQNNYNSCKDPDGYGCGAGAFCDNCHIDSFLREYCKD